MLLKCAGHAVQTLRAGGHVPFPFFPVVEVCGAHCRHYVQEGTFLLDVATLLPLDILYIWLGTGTQPIETRSLAPFLQFKAKE